MLFLTEVQVSSRPARQVRRRVQGARRGARGGWGVRGGRGVRGEAHLVLLDGAAAGPRQRQAVEGARHHAAGLHTQHTLVHLREIEEILDILFLNN